MLDLHTSTLAFLLALWPSGHALPADAPAIVDAIANAVAADAEPVLATHEDDARMMIVNAKEESAFRAHAEGDCFDRMTLRAVRPGLGYDRPDLVPPNVQCRSHGFLQQGARCGFGTVAEQATCWLADFHRSARECSAFPLASLVSGGKRCEAGTHLSKHRTWVLDSTKRKMAAEVPGPVAAE